MTIDELQKKYPFAFIGGIAKPYLDVKKEIQRKLGISTKNQKINYQE